MTLAATIQALSADFATNIVAAIRQASLSELMGGLETHVTKPAKAPKEPAAPRARKAGRLPRRSLEDLNAMADRIVQAVSESSGGLRAEKIRAELGIAPNELARPLSVALADKRLTKIGHKRATIYIAATAKPAKPAKPAKTTKKASKTPKAKASPKTAPKAKKPAKKSAPKAKAKPKAPAKKKPTAKKKPAAKKASATPSAPASSVNGVAEATTA